MGNTLDSAPSKYSDEVDDGQTGTYGGSVGGSYMASYRQDSATADSMQYGNGKLQFGAKIVQDIDPGPNQMQLYVTTNAGKRLYITHKGQLAPYASDYVKQAANYGNGPAVAITGSPLNPHYSMWYSQGGDEHSKSNSWTPIQINSKQDIMEAMQSGMQGMDYNAKHATSYGQASINPFGSQEGSDVWTGAARFDEAVTGVVSQLIIPVAEHFLDAVVPFASTVLGVTGANKAMQGGLDSMIKNSHGQMYKSSTTFDPQMSNILKDPRLSGYLQQQEDQSHGFIAKYGPSDYSATSKLAQDTPQQQLAKARALTEENQNLYVQGAVQEMKDLSAKLQQLAPNADPAIFQQIQTGLGMAQTNQQKLNVINHFSAQLQKDVLPLVGQGGSDATPSSPSSPKTPVTSGNLGASAQVGHPTLSINGTHSIHPGKPISSGNFVPPVPIGFP